MTPHAVFMPPHAIFMTPGLLGDTCRNSRCCDEILDMAVFVLACSYACPEFCMSVSPLLLYDGLKQK